MPNWGQVLDEIQTEEVKLNRRAVSAIDRVRRRYMVRLSKKTGRNVIAYYSGWLTNPNVWR